MNEQHSQTKQAMQYMAAASQAQLAGQAPNTTHAGPDKWRVVPNRAARRKAIRNTIKAQKRRG